MDVAAREWSRIGQGNPSSPSSSVSEEDHWFHQFFDVPRFERDFDWDYLSPPASPHHLDKLITDIPPLIDRFEKMKTSYEVGVDAGSSEYSSHPSPPELVQGEGSTSPSDHSGPALRDQYEEPQSSPRVSLRDFRSRDDQWTLPQSELSKGFGPGYAPHQGLQGAGDTSPAGSNGGAPLGRSNGKRSRQVEHPDQTADVRRSGACLPCRLSKIRCHEHGVCPTCRKAFPHHSHLICARRSLLELWPTISKAPDVWSLKPDEEHKLRAKNARVFIGKPGRIAIFFSKGSPSALTAYIQPYRWQNETEGKLGKAAFSKVLGHEEILAWVEGEIEHRCRGRLDFPLAVQKFLMMYAHYGHHLPKHALVSKVHQMSCFFQVWKTPSFWCKDPKRQDSALPISVQVQLRQIVQVAMNSYERDILNELDHLATPKGQTRPEDKLALWASLWQLMLMYRELAAASQAWLSQERSAKTVEVTNAIRGRSKKLTDFFFPQLCIFYHYQFRMKKSIELSLNGLGRVDKAIDSAFKDMLNTRKHFLESIQGRDKKIDELLGVLVVNHEIKKLNARKRAPKSSKSKKSAEAEDDCDDDD